MTGDVVLGAAPVSKPEQSLADVRERARTAASVASEPADNNLMALFPDRFEQHVRASSDPVAAIAHIAPILSDDEARETVMAAALAWEVRFFLDDLCPERKRRQFLLAVFDHCAEGLRWHPENLGQLVSRLLDPPLPGNRSDFLYTALDDLSAVEAEMIETQLHAVVMGTSKVPTHHRERLAAYLPAPESIDQVLAKVRPGSRWTVALQRRSAELDVEPSLAAAVLRLSVAAVASPSRQNSWLAEFDLIADKPGVVDFARQIVGTAMIEYEDQYLQPEDEAVISGAALLTGAAAFVAGDQAPNDQVVAFLEEVARWGSHWVHKEARCDGVARAAVRGLGLTTCGAAMAALDRLDADFANRRQFRKTIAAARSELRSVELTAEDVVAALGPSFGLSDESTRSWATARGAITVTVRSPGRVCLNAPEETSGSMDDTLARTEADMTASSIRNEIASIEATFEQHLKSGRHHTPLEFAALAQTHPLTSTVAHGLLWQVRAGNSWVTASLDAKQLFALEGHPLPEWEEARLWHPATAQPAELEQLRERALRTGDPTKVDQVFRSVWTEPVDLGRYQRHSVRLRKALRSRDWTMPTAGGGLDADRTTAHWVDGPTGFRAELPLTHEYLSTEGFRNASTWCSFGDLAISQGKATPAEAKVFTSEVLRDIEQATLASMPTGKLLTEPSSPLSPTVIAMLAQPLSPAGQARRRVLEHTLQNSLDAPDLALQEAHLQVSARRKTYRIHLGTGVLTNSEGTVLAKKPKPNIEIPTLPMELNGLLGHILRLALTLSPT